jgi:transposase
MFPRTKTAYNKDGSQRQYLYIVASVREGDKVRQKTIANLGRLDKLQEEGELDKLIDGLAAFSKNSWVQTEAAKLMVHNAKEWGTELIFRHLWKKLGLQDILDDIVARTGSAAPTAEAIYAMVLNRVSEPLSKRAVSQWVDDIHRPEFSALRLRHYYNALDFLEEHKEAIEFDLFHNVKNLFNMELDLVFWDTTSTYFTGEGPVGLAKHGHSKDHRPDRKQLMIGVLMTREGLPVSHQIYPGNTADIETFKDMIKNAGKKFKLGRTIFVGDRGMVSQELLDELDRQGVEYIVGVRMRKVKATEQVLKTGGRYKKINESLYVKEVWSDDADRYIICYNPEEAERDRIVRAETVKKLEDKLRETSVKQMVGHRGYRRYLSIKGPKPTIDLRTIKNEARYDGKYVLRTNAMLDTDEVAQAYKELWRVERAFRDLKSTLSLRPMYHWKESRVRGHVMVCFLALVLESALQNHLPEEVEYSYLIRDLKQLRAVELTLSGEKYLCRTELPGCSNAAFKALGIRPPNLTTKIN